jgi:RNA polymerase sigma factor (sigma-70 family)
MAQNSTAPSYSSRNSLIAAQMRPALVKYFRRKCGNADEAEDLAQDVLVRSLAHATWESADQAKGYIFRAAVNRWHDRQRIAHTHGTTVEWNDATAPTLDEETTPEYVLEIEQELHRVHAALMQLKERTRDIFVLIRVEQMKQSAVAEMLGVSVSTVEKELAKALAHLARCTGVGDGAP